jgi:FtsP/CotA-like multicopper oxidase with cupredoxin domain
MAALGCWPALANAQSAGTDRCPRPAAGSTVPEPPDLRSNNGVLEVELEYRSFTAADGQTRYCYVSGDGSEAPTLRLKPGDQLILHLKNELAAAPQSKPPSAGAPITPMKMGAGGDPIEMSMSMAAAGPCASSKMTPVSTNLHFHGLTVPPVCHQDDVMNTMIQPGDAPFEYRFQIPADEPPGLYWYHPHIHGFTKAQVLGGASGAMIVEGIERTNRELAGMPERVMIVRDQDMVNPNAAPASGGVVMPPAVLDAEGDAMNNGTGSGKPAKDLSLNFVPVPYPDYPPAVIAMRPSERQLWRVLNASAITYLNLQVLIGAAPQALGVVAMDGVPVNQNGMSGNQALWVKHIGVPPGGRMEFIVTGPPNGQKGILVTRSVNTGAMGENDPERTLASIVASAAAPEPRSKLAAAPQPLPPPILAWIGNVNPVRTRRLYFSEIPQDPKDPNSPTTFMITVEGQTPKPFDMNTTVPNIVAQQGDVEDWIIENRTQELHDFHIHQIHFMLLEWFGLHVDEPFLRDTVNVPFWDGKSPDYPMVKLRMDFRDPSSVGTYPYHCHLLEHEDGGMMGLIRVEPRSQSAKK